ncbi:ABC transporter family protein [Stackebrandtia endophytica]|uniref:ABC transporter family protein n=1 Tax=Stackebrandtia endophytica TaxID=1496996 RepID=A0A543AQ74_9ACTN|nr:ATP-binding cassette domain-containing protein [Stackebrandtia endophytica]TQL74709.1 ABC transporter family protein [Stackebrandtia endophytica]
MTDSWRVWRRSVTAAPILSGAVGLLAILNTGCFILVAIIVSRIVALAADSVGRDMTWPMVWLFASLVGTAVTGVLMGPLWLRVERRILLSQIDEITARLEHDDSPDSNSASIVERVVSVPHREALRAIPELLRARCRGWAGVIGLALVSPVAAAVLAVGAMLYGRSFTRFLDDVLAGSAAEGPSATRRARYVRSLQFDHRVAGELRGFRALPWLLRVFTDLSAAGRAEAFDGRRRRVRIVIGHAVLCGLVLSGCVAWLLGSAWSGELGIAEVSLAIQGALLALGLGPAGDVAVLFGQVARTERDLFAPTTASTEVPSTEPNRALSNRALPNRAATNGADSMDGEPHIVIACRGLRHRYPGRDQWALDVPELTIRRGERVAVVGPNGAGKSTLLGLVAGYLTASEGTVTVRADRSIAMQRAVRYPATLAQNVQLGSREVDTARLMSIVDGHDLAAQRAESLLGTPGMGGETLSGGQWQRVGLARAFGHVGDGVLLLDEPSAALDPVSEERFFRTALNQRHEVTVLVSTHHLANTRFVDRVIVMDSGRVVADGDPAELSREGGRYADMVTAQARSYGVVADA